MSKPKTIIAAIFAITTFTSVAGAQEALVTFRVLSPETALKAATAALASCRKQGYQIAVSVVDRMGVVQVTLRDRFAGSHTPETSQRKAWTAVSFRTNTTDLSERAKPGSEMYGINFIPKALALGGGVIIQGGGSIVGGIGVSGAPGGKLDEACANAGINAIEADINM